MSLENFMTVLKLFNQFWSLSIILSWNSRSCTCEYNYDICFKISETIYYQSKSPFDFQKLFILLFVLENSAASFSCNTDLGPDMEES